MNFILKVLSQISFRKKLLIIALSVSMPALFYIFIAANGIYDQYKDYSHKKIELFYLANLNDLLLLSEERNQLRILNFFPTISFNYNTLSDNKVNIYIEDIIPSLQNSNFSYLGNKVSAEKETYIQNLMEQVKRSKNFHTPQEVYNYTKQLSNKAHFHLNHMGQYFSLTSSNFVSVYRNTDIYINKVFKLLNLETHILYLFLKETGNAKTNEYIETRIALKNLQQNLEYIRDSYNIDNPNIQRINQISFLIQTLTIELDKKNNSTKSLYYLRQLFHLISQRLHYLPKQVLQDISTSFIVEHEKQLYHRWIGLLFRIISLVVGYGIAHLVFYQLNKALEEFNIAFVRLANGDFSLVFNNDHKDEFHILHNTYNNLVQKLKILIVQTSDVYAKSGEHISVLTVKSQDVVRSAQEQVAFLEEASASVEELSASTNNILLAAKKQLVDIQNSTNSITEIHQTFLTIDTIQNNIQETANSAMKKAKYGGTGADNLAKAMEQVSETTTQIVGITDIIKDIADQTALLALNASIEAARAGEYGKGFAVVAKEITELADRCTDSSKEIALLLETANQNTNRGVLLVKENQNMFRDIIIGMENLVEHLKNVRNLEKQQLEALTKTSNSAKLNAILAKDILDATDLQNQSAEEITIDMSRTNDIISYNVKELEYLNSSLETLAEQIKIGSHQLHIFYKTSV